MPLRKGSLMPWPGQEGRADYCGVQAHTYRMGPLWEDGKLRCVNCHWVKGQRGKRK